jgi:hypothetical protein
VKIDFQPCLKKYIFSYLNNSFKGFVTFLICARFLQVPTDPDIFAKKYLAVILKPIQNLGEIKNANLFADIKYLEINKDLITKLRFDKCATKQKKV